MKDFRSTFKDRSVLVTGHTGFKGSWLTLWLATLGAKVSGYALDPPTSPNHFEVAEVSELLENDFRGDIRDINSLRKAFNKCKPEFIFHLAAQPLVIESLLNPKDTFDVNVVGTCSVLDVIRERDNPCVVLVITSDKCYRNNGERLSFKETDPLGGNDPYSASKAATELVVQSYRKSFFHLGEGNETKIKVASARAGNVIGGGDWALDRIVPDSINALHSGKPLEIRNPKSTRPWQHVLEPLSGYLLLAASIDGQSSPVELQSSWNFGPNSDVSTSVGTLVDLIIEKWGGGSWTSKHSTVNVEAQSLSIDVSKAKNQIHWSSRWDLDETIQATVRWYREYLSKSHGSMRNRSVLDISEYEKHLEEEI